MKYQTVWLCNVTADGGVAESEPTAGNDNEWDWFRPFVLRFPADEIDIG